MCAEGGKGAEKKPGSPGSPGLGGSQDIPMGSLMQIGPAQFRVTPGGSR